MISENGHETIEQVIQTTSVDYLTDLLMQIKELSTYFEKDGYSEIDLAELDRYNALTLIKNEDTGYSSFIVQLPS